MIYTNHVIFSFDLYLGLILIVVMYLSNFPSSFFKLSFCFHLPNVWSWLWKMHSLTHCTHCKGTPTVRRPNAYTVFTSLGKIDMCFFSGPSEQIIYHYTKEWREIYFKWCLVKVALKRPCRVYILEYFFVKSKAPMIKLCIYSLFILYYKPGVLLFHGYKYKRYQFQTNCKCVHVNKLSD